MKNSLYSDELILYILRSAEQNTIAKVAKTNEHQI